MKTRDFAISTGASCAMAAAACLAHGLAPRDHLAYGAASGLGVGFLSGYLMQGRHRKRAWLIGVPLGIFAATFVAYYDPITSSRWYKIVDPVFGPLAIILVLLDIRNNKRLPAGDPQNPSDSSGL